MYDGEFEGQMSMLHDANKRLIKVSDIYPEFADLKKGEYTIRLQLRHDDAALLDKMKDAPVVVERKLKEPVMVPVYATVRDAVKAAKPVKERSLYAGKPHSSVSICLMGCFSGNGVGSGKCRWVQVIWLD